VFLFAISVPFFIAVTLLLPGHRHLALAVSTTVATACAAHEVVRLMLGPHRNRIAGGAAIAASAGVPAVTWLQIAGVAGEHALLGYLAGAAGAVLLVCTVPSRHPAEEPVRERASAAVLALLYPGLLISYVVRMASLDHAGQVLLAFFILVFGTDIAGYLAGRLTRARPCGLPVSPNKTVVGFAGAMFMALILGIGVTRLFPAALPFGVAAALGLGAAVGAATIAGDLVESAIKRAAAVKHSGSHIPGRGGVMDSIDSILLGAPVFYAVVA
jgi:phosphatidate cytidylyltransferase